MAKAEMRRVEYFFEYRKCESQFGHSFSSCTRPRDYLRAEYSPLCEIQHTPCRSPASSSASISSIGGRRSRAEQSRARREEVSSEERSKFFVWSHGVETIFVMCFPYLCVPGLCRIAEIGLRKSEVVSRRSCFVHESCIQGTLSLSGIRC